MPRKILFVNPSLMKPVVTPVAIDYLTQVLEKKGFATEILDLAFAEDSGKELKRYLGRDDYLLIAITIRNIDDSYFASQDFCLERIKVVIDQIRNLTESPLVLGGVGFSLQPESALSYCGVDIGVKGEGEWSLPRLAERLAGELNSVSWSNKKDVSRVTTEVMERERSTLLTSVKGGVAV